MKKRYIGIFFVLLVIFPIFSAAVAAEPGAILKMGQFNRIPFPCWGTLLTTSITNTGDENATDINFTIEFEKYFRIFGRGVMLCVVPNKKSIPCLTPGESVIIYVFTIGFGIFRVTATVDSPDTDPIEKNLVVVAIWTLIDIKQQSE